MTKKNSKKIALIITCGQYSDPALHPLKTSEFNAKELKTVLEDKNIGGFEVLPLIINKNAQEVKESLEAFFFNYDISDLLLLYLSGHGIKDKNGKLYFAASDTKMNFLFSTGISASFIAELMKESCAKRQILLLDCCFSGAFGKGIMGANFMIEGKTQFEEIGKGKFIITSSSATQFSEEGQESAVIDDCVSGEEFHKCSIFTRELVKGLRTGEADRNSDGYITIDELYDYIYARRTSKQTPQWWALDNQGKANVVVAQNPNVPNILEIECPVLKCRKTLKINPNLQSVQCDTCGTNLLVRRETDRLSLIIDSKKRSEHFLRNFLIGMISLTIALPSAIILERQPSVLKILERFNIIKPIPTPSPTPVPLILALAERPIRRGEFVKVLSYVDCIIRSIGSQDSNLDDIFKEIESGEIQTEPPKNKSSIKFPDVEEDASYRDALVHIAERGIVEGFADGSFRGQEYLSRYDMASILTRYVVMVTQMAQEGCLREETGILLEDLERIRRLAEKFNDNSSIFRQFITDHNEFIYYCHSFCFAPQGKSVKVELPSDIEEAYKDSVEFVLRRKLMDLVQISFQDSGTKTGFMGSNYCSISTVKNASKILIDSGKAYKLKSEEMRKKAENLNTYLKKQYNVEYLFEKSHSHS